MNPYLFSNFHSMPEKGNPLSQQYHRYAFSSNMDYNGCGVRPGQDAIKFNGLANFSAVSPTLPYFMNNRRLNNEYVAKNCLICCKYEDNNLLITSQNNKIVGLLLNDQKVNNSFDFDDSIEKDSHILRTISSTPHMYSTGESVSDGPFRYCNRRAYDLYVDEEVNETEDFRPIFELKVNIDDQNVTQIQSNSRNKIRFFDLKGDESDLSFDLKNELKIENLRRSDESLFENSDKNVINFLLTSYTTSDFIDLYTLETNQIIRSFDSNELNHKTDKEIGLYWARSHPMFFFVGHHKRLHYCDARTRNSVLEIETINTRNLCEWEMFYQFLPSKLNPNQVFVATDYHIFMADVRYPKQNLIQLNHMLPNDSIIRSLKSEEVIKDNTKTELLISSTYYRNCLMSFNDCNSSVSLSSTHLPLHMSSPKDVDKRFEEYFYRGIQLMESADNLGFSLALLTNSEDVFMQDFFWITSDEALNAREGEPHYKDRTYWSGPGSTSLRLNPKAFQYMEVINNYLFRLKCEATDDSNSRHECVPCSDHRVCKKDEEDGQCLCKDNIFPITLTPETSEDESTEVITELDEHLGPILVQNRQQLQNLDQLNETTDYYTKDLLDLWDVSSENEDIPKDKVT